MVTPYQHSQRYEKLVLLRQSLKDNKATTEELESNRVAIGKEIREWNHDLIITFQLSRMGREGTSTWKPQLH